jgi:hypothetical protein
MAEKEKKDPKDKLKPGSHAPRYDLGQAVDLAIAIYEKTGGVASRDEFSDITGNTQKSSS